MAEIVPREEVEFSSLYGEYLKTETPLKLELFDSRRGESSVARLPFPPESSGHSWMSRLERARESLPRAHFKPTRPRIYNRDAGRMWSGSSMAVTVLALEVPQRRGRGRPKKESTVVVDAAAANRNSFFVKRTYNYPHNNNSNFTNADEEVEGLLNTLADGTMDESNASCAAGGSGSNALPGIHTAENYMLHGHGGADIDVYQIGILRPEFHYIRSSVPVNGGSEYDLDEQDLEWLKMANLPGLTEDLMERIIEALENGWDRLTRPLRRLQQRREASMYPEEMPCEICGESDTSNCNVIVLCDDCDLAVHQECYGVPHIPEGPWLCRRCEERHRYRLTVSPKCLMCPWPNGALRKTSDHRWVHSLCAWMVPESAYSFNPADPDDLVDVCTLPPERAKLRCVLCKIDYGMGGGYPIQCASKLCHVAFHPLCARKAGWLLDYANQGAFCARHNEAAATDLESSSKGSTVSASASASKPLKIRINLKAPDSPTSPHRSPSPSRSPTATATNSASTSTTTIQITSDPPLHYPRLVGKMRLQTLAPRVLIDAIVADVDGAVFSAVEGMKRNQKAFEDPSLSQLSRNANREAIVTMIARYWSLKREFRRGTPLLKSLQLEPCWSDLNERVDEGAFVEELKRRSWLSDELERLGGILKAIHSREVAKLESIRSLKNSFEIISQPFNRVLVDFLHFLQRNFDRPGYFAHPVPSDMFPDYPSVIKHPMDFSTILRNLRLDSDGGRESDTEEDQNGGSDFVSTHYYYPTLAHFCSDVILITDNSKLYNTRTSVFYMAADRLANHLPALMEALAVKLHAIGVIGPTSILNGENRNEKVLGEDVSPALLVNWKALPPSSSERFPAKPANVGSMSASTEFSSSSSSGSFSSVKRRGRPPKPKISSSSSSSSLEFQVKRRGRPPKKT